ncbi:Phosphate-binding protein PstS precursor [Polystyrenella longa]|uniref:Phosphate-binding protein n=1 Tax=Polystyrenella longa TaxID=2528007 RepID=A0A518CHL5_9PLAN|nr:PstS family phosphate ABC transporter substrate-binding protein [Polystyrenella longa]QDU78719.1 Phosphate-binding protein PstS precursor [Polystyrenella longa]
MRRICSVLMLTMLLCFAATGCKVENTNSTSNVNSTGDRKVSKEIQIDGSSTVFPISQAVAEEYMKENSDINVTVGLSGTGGGFKRFIRGETDINDASRPIKESELKSLKDAGIEFIELTIAIDGLSVIVHPENDWCDAITTEQLNMIWKPGSEITTWKQVDENWPDEPFKLYGPDTDSGTFDYFTEAINGEEGASRSEYVASSDDNILVRGVSGDKYSLGYFGYAYYVENKNKLKVLSVANGNDVSIAVEPTAESIEAGKYVPLSRPLFLYVRKDSLQKPHVATFLRYYLNEGQNLVNEVGYVNLSEEQLKTTKQTLEEGVSK